MSGAMDESPLLEVQELGYSYGTRAACAGITFDLYPGEVLAVVGESGSGKTTLLRCISGQLRPDEGRVLFQTRAGEIADVWEIGRAHV